MCLVYFIFLLNLAFPLQIPLPTIFVQCTRAEIQNNLWASAIHNCLELHSIEQREVPLQLWLYLFHAWCHMKAEVQLCITWHCLLWGTGECDKRLSSGCFLHTIPEKPLCSTGYICLCLKASYNTMACSGSIEQLCQQLNTFLVTCVKGFPQWSLILKPWRCN